MGLAGEHELHGHLRIADQGRQTLQILEHEVGSLVGGKPPGEADRQGVEAQRRRSWAAIRSRRFAAALGLTRLRGGARSRAAAP